MDKKSCKLCKYLGDIFSSFSLIASFIVALVIVMCIGYFNGANLGEVLLSKNLDTMFVIAVAIAIVLFVISIFRAVTSSKIGILDFALVTSFIMVIMLLLRMLIAGFSSLDMGIAVIIGVLSIMVGLIRILRYAGDGCITKIDEKLRNVTSIKEYLSEFFVKFDPILVALALLAEIFAFTIVGINGDILSLFGNSSALLIIFTVLFVFALAISTYSRVKRREITAIDLVIVLLLPLFVVFVVRAIKDFSVIKMIIAIATLLIEALLAFVVAKYTNLTSHIEEKNKLKGNRVSVVKYYKMLFSNYSIFIVFAVGVMFFAIAFVLAASSGDNSIFSETKKVLLIFSLVFSLLFLVSLGWKSKSNKINNADFMIAVMDIGALLLMIEWFFGVMSSSRFLLWLAFFIVSFIFTVIRVGAVEDFALALNDEVAPCCEESHDGCSFLESTDENSIILINDNNYESDEQPSEENADPTSEIVDDRVTIEDSTTDDEDSEIEREPSEEITDSISETVDDVPEIYEGTTEYEGSEYRDNVAIESVFGFARTKPLTFVEKVENLPEDVKEYYRLIKERLLSYNRVKSRVSKKYDKYNRGKHIVAKIVIAGKSSLRVYLSLDPNEFNESKYHHKNASERRAFAMVPTMLRVKSPRACKYALELIDKMLGADDLLMKKVAPDSEILATIDPVENEIGLSDATAEDRLKSLSKYKSIPFEEKIRRLEGDSKRYYDGIVTQFEGYHKVKSRLSKKCINYYRGRTSIAKITIVGKNTVKLYLALDPASYNANKYHHRDVSDKKTYANVPMMLKVKSERAFKYSKELIDEYMRNNEIAKL